MPAIATTVGSRGARPRARRASMASTGRENSSRTGTPVTTTRSGGMPRATNSFRTSSAATQ